MAPRKAPKPKPPIESAGFAVFHKGKILILRCYGTRDFPKGKIEEGESYLEAARRELREETGITNINLIEEKPIKVAYRLKSGKDKIVYFFIGEVSSPTVKLSDEHHSYEWLDPNDAVDELPERFQSFAVLLTRYVS